MMSQIAEAEKQNKDKILNLTEEMDSLKKQVGECKLTLKTQ